MDKLSFLALLAEKLSHYPISEEEMDKHIGIMRNYISSVSDEEFESENPTEADVQEIAEGIYKKFYAKQSETVNEPQPEETEAIDVEVQDEAPEAPEACNEEPEITEEVIQEPEQNFEAELSEELTVAEEPVAEVAEAVEEAAELAPAEEEITEETDTGDDYLLALAEEAEEERRAAQRIEELTEKAIQRAEKAGEDVSAIKEELLEASVAENDPIIEAIDPEEHPDVAFDEDMAQREYYTSEHVFAPEGEFEPDTSNLRSVDETKQRKGARKKKRQKISGTPLFWVLFILTLPITLPILAVICVLFGVLYSAVTAVIVALCVLMAATVALGTALALIGIIYGITELSTLPIGLFEIGFGIAIGGATMLVSVLLYNVAIRFAPKLYKCLNKLGSLVFGGIGDLYYNAKKECGR